MLQAIFPLNLTLSEGILTFIESKFRALFNQLSQIFAIASVKALINRKTQCIK